MYQPINPVRLRGFLTESARLFISRSGQPRINFRMEVRIDDENLPPKKPVGVDYFSVAAFGTDFVGLRPQLGLEREVTLVGRLRSRDVDTDGCRIVTAIVAHATVPLKMRADDGDEDKSDGEPDPKSVHVFPDTDHHRDTESRSFTS